MPSEFLDNPLVRYLEEQDPTSIVLAGLPVGASRGMLDFAQTYGKESTDRFRGAISQRAIQGQPLDLMFTDWWRNTYGAPFEQPGRSGPEVMQQGLMRQYRRNWPASRLGGPITRHY